MMNVTIKNTESKLRKTFFTDATLEDIEWCIKIHENRHDLIRLWDRNRIECEIDWVSYHLRRAGFEISEKKENYLTIVKEVSLLRLNS